MKQIWFGTRENMQWIPQCAEPAEWTKVGYTSKSQYLNGGARVRNSKAGHREYTMVWGPGRTRDELRPISDYADGVFDTSDGPNLIYFITPDAADKNVAPQGWAFPGQSDAMPLVVGATPALVATPANTNLYPARSAQYVIAGTETAASVYIPIPPGYVAWVGAHGTATGSTGVRVTPYIDGTTPDTATDLTLLAVTSTTRVNASFSADDYYGIEVAPIIAAGTLTLSGLMVQILRAGVTPSVGGFISGQGHSGCEFDGKPQPSAYMIGSTRESFGMTGKLIEVGSWA